MDGHDSRMSVWDMGTPALKKDHMQSRVWHTAALVAALPGWHILMLDSHTM